ncbi:valine--tRNA ligase [Candidatus Woesearchaeota archaeon CG10_big_fil_rev_8_21_14_0_10_34_8]|nr:MAG: valine--tRNA ligase [Candidatus Woesearchaeota archaeon CG10_big_fil_rev_8_21_14_0_10_34_8]
MELPKNYDAKEVEEKWMKYWEKERIYSFDPDSKKEVFSIDTPPPTVSGKMHLGHAFSYSQQDFIVRYKRMRGFNIFYPFGTDDNGLPTERLIEKEKHVKAEKMGRSEFAKLCLEILAEIRKKYIQDWKNIGMSCDWNIFYTTINDHCQRISQRSFLELYKIGREYRKESPVVWCTECKTAIAQVELEDKEKDSFFNDIVFKLEDGKELVIATTRPELLPACVAIFAHPEDERYKYLFGKKAKVPLFNFWVEIMPSEKADPSKGTGILMCCTFGDMDDAEHYKEFKLPLRIAIARDGRMTSITEVYEGMTVPQARKAIIEALKTEGLLKDQKPIKHVTNIHERCGTEIEILESKQWFIKYLDLKGQFLEAGSQMKWHPEHMINRYTNWINGLQWDWCISRQRYFGVPFPVWYCKDCEEIILAKEEDLPVDPLSDKPPVSKCAKCGCTEFIPEKDVMDTWATSSLTPQIATELFKDKPIYKKLFPMSLRPQAHDIITFWLFNTVVKSQLHTGSIPWNNIAISGWALDPHGKKMSKSKGNVIEPQEIIQKYSADCLRFWAAGSKLGEDMPTQDKDFITGKKTITKLWNATKFALIHLEDYDLVKTEKEVRSGKFILEELDQWLLSKLHKTIEACTESFEEYEYSKSKHETDKFFWQILCDNYLELVKDRLYNPDTRGKESRRSAQYVLYQSFSTVLKLFAPLLPFVTEEIYHLYFAKAEGEKSVHIAHWPQVKTEWKKEAAEQSGDLAVQALERVRRLKSEKNLSLKTPVQHMLIRGTVSPEEFHKIVGDLRAATVADKIEYEKLPQKSNIDFECEIDMKIPVKEK